MATHRARPTRAAALDKTDKTPIPTELPDTLQFMRLLWAIVHALQKTSKRMATELGITGPQRLVLRVVGLFPGVSAGNLASILHVHPSTLTGVLQRLSDQQLLMRSEHVLDRRRAVLHLTARGARVNAVRGGTIEAAVGRALKNVTGHDRVVTRRVLGTLTEYLEQPSSPRPARRSARTRR